MLAVLLGFVAGASTDATADDSAPLSTRWASRAWELNDLIPGEGAGGSVRGIVQAPDGSLVIATTVGLVRFDGDSLTRIALDLPPGEQPNVLHVARGKNGAIAAVLASGRVLWLDDRTGVRSVPPPPDETDVPATSLAIDMDGVAWVANERGGVWSVSHDGTSRLVTAGTIAPAGRGHLTVSVDGTIWVSMNAILYRARDTVLDPMGNVPPGLSIVTGASDGGVWLMVQGQLFRYALDGSQQPIVPNATTFDSLPVRDVIRTARSLSEDDEGRLWLCSSRYGLFVLENGVLAKVDIGETWVTGATTDREGSIWVGTRLAIHRVRPAIAWPTSLPTWRPIVALRSDGQGTTWCLTQNGEVGSWTDDRPEDFKLLSDLGQQRAVALDTSRDGNLWVALENGAIRCFGPDAEVVDQLPEPPAVGRINSLLACDSGDLWVVADTGLLRRRQGHWKVIQGSLDESAEDDLPRQKNRAVEIEAHMARDPTGGIWVVTDTMVGRAGPEDDRLALVPTARLGAGRPGLIVSAQDDRLWVVLKGVGLARWHDSRWSVIGMARGLPTNSIVGAAFDTDGRLWCATPRMLFIVDMQELEQVADGDAERLHCWVLPPRYETYFLEGLATPFCAMLRGADGRLLVARQSGLVVCQPERLPVVPAPAVAIRKVSCDQGVTFTPSALAAGTQPVLPPMPRRVEVAFGASTLLAPLNAVVEYRLEGIDATWIQAPLHGRITYASLPSGTHRFWLRSSTQASDWAPSEPSLTLMVTPPIWETWWFRAAVLSTVAGSAAAVAGVVASFRNQRRLTLLRQQALVHDERMRLARDMHDEVGTNLTQIALLTEIAMGDEPAQQLEHLETVTRISRQTVAALDELVWAVDPGNDTLIHLLSYACRYASETLREFGIACEVDRPGDLPAVSTPGEFRRGVLLIVKEAITNIIAHARAPRVILRLGVTDGQLEISVRDDGIGIAEMTTEGSGLANMRHRATELGGECRIVTGKGVGTRIELRVPLPELTRRPK
jgi:signal transduction histidine kinase/ligand-binding sensor domain-containing protein